MWKFARFWIACLPLFAAGGPAGATPPHALTLALCVQHPVQFPGLVTALNRYVGACSGVPACQVYQLETLQIAAYGQIQQWLVTTSNMTAFYSPAQQNAIIGNTHNIANQNRPPGKQIYKISFFQDLVVPNQPPTVYFLGANVTYAKCRPGSSKAN